MDIKQFQIPLMYLQLMVWAFTAGMVLYFVFASNSPYWPIPLIIGLAVQLISVILNAVKGSLNKVWLGLIISQVAIFVAFYSQLAIFNDVQVVIISILIINILYFSSIIQILKEIRRLQAARR